MVDIVVKNGHVYRGGSVDPATIGIADSRIKSITDAETVPAADRTIDADGGLVLPGLVNAHTHSPMTLFRGFADNLPFETWLHERIVPAEEQLSREDVLTGARLAALEMIRTGTTAFADMYFAMDAVVQAVEEAGLRATLGPGVVVDDPTDEAAVTARVEEVAAFADEYAGAADGRVQTMYAPHALYSCPDEGLELLAAKADATGRLYHLHANETIGEVDRLREQYDGTDPIVHLDDLGVLDSNAFVAHAVHLTDSEIAVLAERNVAVAHCPAANAKLGNGIAPISALVEAGVPVCLGTDGVASNNSLDLLEEMKVAALLGKARERDATTLDTSTVIKMATRNGARAIGQPGGVIAPGEPADLIVLDGDSPNFTPGYDLLSDAVYAATGGDVTTTIVDGSVLMADRTVETLDPAQVYADAARVVNEADWA